MRPFAEQSREGAVTDEDEIRFVGSDAGNSRDDHFDAHSQKFVEDLSRAHWRNVRNSWKWNPLGASHGGKPARTLANTCGWRPRSHDSATHRSESLFGGKRKSPLKSPRDQCAVPARLALTSCRCCHCQGKRNAKIHSAVRAPPI